MAGGSDAAAEVGIRLRRKRTFAASSQRSDAAAALPPAQPFAPEAREFMDEKGLDAWETDGTTVILECCTEASRRRLHMYPS